MKNNNWRRNRRGNNQPQKNNINPLRNQFDSNGPNGRIKGNAQQLCDKYQGWAREANSDDRVLQESYWQYAEHYQRLLNEFNDREGDEKYSTDGQYDDAYTSTDGERPNEFDEETAEKPEPIYRERSNDRNSRGRGRGYNDGGYGRSYNTDGAVDGNGGGNGAGSGAGAGNGDGTGGDEPRNGGYQRQHRQYPPRVSRPNRFDKMARQYESDYSGGRGYGKPNPDNNRGDYGNDAPLGNNTIDDSDDEGQLPSFIKRTQTPTRYQEPVADESGNESPRTTRPRRYTRKKFDESPDGYGDS